MPGAMLQGSRHSKRAVVNLASAQSDGAVALPRVPLLRPRITLRPRYGIRPVAGPIALGVLVAACIVVVVVASAVPTTLVPTSRILFPGWMAGPFHSALGDPLYDLVRRNGLTRNFGYAFSALFVLMLLAYGTVLACARSISMRTITTAIAVMYGFILLGPPLEMSDIFNYLGYARLGALHGLNPYTHVIANEHYDPVSLFVSWHHWPSPYGPLFTLLTYPISGLSLSNSYWAMKLAMVLLSAGFVALVWQCARQLGHDPRFAVLFVGVNPIVLIYEVGGFHNDAVMLVPAMGAVSLLLARRYRWAGAAVALAIAVKFTAVLLLPFLLIAARPARRSLQVALGSLLAGIPLALASVAAFGFSLPNAADQSTIVTPLSVVNLLGVTLGLGGSTPHVEEAAKVGLVLIAVGLVVLAALRGRPDWLSGAGWASLALLCCLSWLMPWYIIWALPLAALSTSPRLRRATLAFTAFAAVSFLPVTWAALRDIKVNPMRTPADHAANVRLAKVMH
jgi:hypothetical protein